MAYFCIQFPMMKHLFWVLVLEGLLGLHKINNFCFFGIIVWGRDLDYSDIEWFALERTEIILLFLILHPSTEFQALLLNMMATFISSEGFLPTVVDIMAI